MIRRDFISLLGGAAAWPLGARAQQPAAKLPTIGFLGVATATAWNPFVASFVRRLGELGWVEGRTVAIEYRWADARNERFAEIAAEFVWRKVDIIVTAGTAVAAAKQETSTVPIVFAIAVDPIGMGLVDSLARPGGNITGLSLQAPDIAGKRLELLREIVPNLRRLAVMANVANSQVLLEVREVRAAAGTLGLTVVLSEIRRPDDIAPAFKMLEGRADALYVCSNDPLVHANQVRINTLALAARLPTIYANREYIEAAGLMSYGPNVPDLFRRAGDYVDKILRGTKPADMPVEQPTKFDLVINLTTAKALGLTIPESFLLRADEVIE
jgi:putative tryptophan/tyrosine transport system substrate-binding protein